MKITVIALMCQSIGAAAPVDCREEVVAREDMPMQICMLSQAAVAEWKSRSIFRADSWRVARIRCIPGDYQPKEAA